MTAAIRIQNLSKMYHIGVLQRGPRSLKAALAENLAEPVRRLQKRWRRSSASGAGGHAGEPDTIWALKDVSFDIQPGEVVGILGANGSGKSTLMKVLGRVTTPTAGRVEVRGRVGSLLEVGTGFDPEFTGRENVYLSGPILGMSRKEIDAKFDQIVAFADVEQFLDTPVKHYSSGMQMRLGFAVAAHLDPEILLVDEALSVGDPVFQAKCLARMTELARSGRTVLFVSHDAGSIAGLCTRAVILNKGRLQLAGPAAAVLKEYAAILIGDAVSDKAAEPDADARAAEQQLHALLDAPAEEPAIEPLAQEVASSLLNRLPGMLVEELVHRLGPSLAGHVSEYLNPHRTPPSAPPASPVSAPPELANGAASRNGTGGPSMIITPPAAPDLNAATPAVFQLKNWDQRQRSLTEYLAEANALGMDLNDWLDEYLGWSHCGLITHHVLRPWLTATARVCELGAGSGRWARHVLPRIAEGYLHLVEGDPAMVAYLKKYFESQERVQCHHLEGHVLPLPDGAFDLAYAFDVFAVYPLGKVDVFVREFARILRPGGRCVVLYLDTSAPLTWEFLRAYGTRPSAYAESFSYHAPQALDRVFQTAGFAVERRRHLQDVCEGFPMTALVAVRQ